MLPLIIICIQGLAHAQINPPADSLKVRNLPPQENLSKQYDFGDLMHEIFHPQKKSDTLHKPSGITIVPNISANPTIGFQAGIKAVAGIKFGDDPNTLLSIGATSASITTKGIIYFYFNHNIFTPGNKWNFQGNLVASRSVTPDHGIGIGVGQTEGTDEDQILANPTHKGYAIHSQYYNFREKVYKQVEKNLYLGAGMSFEIRRKMNQADTVDNATPMSVYNNRYGFPEDHYSANGFLFNLEYITRDNPNRAYKGIYFDAGIRVNQIWIGSTKNSMQFTTDFRKYFSLSQENPETVFAFWNWGSYLVSGAVPYLELPGTGRDGTFRSGRGYVAQYFKGTQYNDTEAEFRFPILKNKFISGVAFFNLQTANDQQGTRLFQVFQPGGGAGLRVLFSKVTRTNLALDYAYGKFGNRGFFLNLNEAF
jgi:hypothetical protein